MLDLCIHKLYHYWIRSEHNKDQNNKKNQFASKSKSNCVDKNKLYSTVLQWTSCEKGYLQG